MITIITIIVTIIVRIVITIFIQEKALAMNLHGEDFSLPEWVALLRRHRCCKMWGDSENLGLGFRGVLKIRGTFQRGYTGVI